MGRFIESLLYKLFLIICLGVATVLGFYVVSISQLAQAKTEPPLDSLIIHHPFHVRQHKQNPSTVVGLSPQQIWPVYKLPGIGGKGTIALIDAYDDSKVQSDLNTFSSTFGLPNMPICTSPGQSTCFEKHEMAPKLRTNSGWALEESLDTQWAHAIAPNAHILLVEARSASGNDLLNAVNYARNRSDVVAVSMSWSGNEFSGESAYDGYFTSPYGATFFAASGDSGSGVQWPAVSVNVVGVGGTTLSFVNGQFSSETAWSGSGGGLSSYETEPSYQSTYGVPQANGYRAVPDTSYDADPSSSVAVYDSIPYEGLTGWFEVGGTSVGTPSWAGIRALGGTNVNNTKFYHDAATTNYASYFRDITSGSNGVCGFYCNAVTNYDYATGLGSPLTTTY